VLLAPEIEWLIWYLQSVLPSSLCFFVCWVVFVAGFGIVFFKDELNNDERGTRKRNERVINVSTNNDNNHGLVVSSNRLVGSSPPLSLFWLCWFFSASTINQYDALRGMHSRYWQRIIGAPCSSFALFIRAFNLRLYGTNVLVFSGTSSRFCLVFDTGNNDCIWTRCIYSFIFILLLLIHK